MQTARRWRVSTAATRITHRWRQVLWFPSVYNINDDDEERNKSIHDLNTRKRGCIRYGFDTYIYRIISLALIMKSMTVIDWPFRLEIDDCDSDDDARRRHHYNNRIL